MLLTILSEITNAAEGSVRISYVRNLIRTEYPSTSEQFIELNRLLDVIEKLKADQ